MTEGIVKPQSSKAEPEFWVISTGRTLYPRRRRAGRKSATPDLEARVTEGLQGSLTDCALVVRAGEPCGKQDVARSKPATGESP